jgi:mono/diheme cytochrome c family protein
MAAAGRVGWIVLGLAGITLLGLAGFIAHAWYPRIDAIEPPARTAFDRAEIRRGAGLAAIGNCNVCHTAPGGRPFAGGLAVATPFGKVFSTNITPDPETGIGRWSEAAFNRAMRKGVDRRGRHLYPAFPYDHFTLVSDADNRALYAYLMTREPVGARTPAPELPFPLDIRTVVAGWKLLYFREGPFRADPAGDAELNRGAYLVEGLAHCGACHTPRNALGAEKRGRAFAGSEVEGWHAYALDPASPAPVPWQRDTLHAYLRQGWHENHGVARGPMAPVTANLAAVPDADVRAIARYVMDRMAPVDAQRRQRADELIAAARKPADAPNAGGEHDRGRQLYGAACASCHDGGRLPPLGGMSLRLSSGVTGPLPTNLINVILFGLPAAEGEPSPIMPGFADAMDDAQVKALVAYIRAGFSDRPPWTDLDRHIARARVGEVVLHPSDGISTAPADPQLGALPW